VLILGGFILLLTRRSTRGAQPPPFALPARDAARPWQQRVLPGRRAQALPEEDDVWDPLPPLPEPPASAPLKPPGWMIEAGLLKEESGEWPAADPQGP
jgi:hypothetical protein